jgi:hypothetical protein
MIDRKLADRLNERNRLIRLKLVPVKKVGGDYRSRSVIQNKSPDMDEWILSARDWNTICMAAMTLALPEPADMAECEEQISALEADGGWTYGFTHPRWGQLVLERLIAAWGDNLRYMPQKVGVRRLRLIVTEGPRRGYRGRPAGPGSRYGTQR